MGYSSVQFFLNSQSQVLGVRELEEVANGDNGGLAGEEGLGNLYMVSYTIHSMRERE